MQSLLQMVSQTLHIWQCAHCLKCSPYYRWSHRQCIFGSVNTALNAVPTINLRRTLHMIKMEASDWLRDKNPTLPLVETTRFQWSKGVPYLKFTHCPKCSLHTAPNDQYQVIKNRDFPITKVWCIWGSVCIIGSVRGSVWCYFMYI